MNPRVLRVQGKAVVSANPDQVVLSFALALKGGSYADTINALNEHVEILRRDLGTSGVPRDDLKTTNFAVHTTFRKEKGRDVFDGYVASHNLKLTVPMDRDRLNQVLATVARSLSEPRINISFSLKDDAPLRKRALEAVVANAKQNAQVLATAAGITLGKILSVEYGRFEMQISSSVDYCMESCSGPMATPDITPEEVDAEDSVTVTWEIAS
ncbi:MAG: SIMPL domain-containing protein [Verrucomicrobia bacterium]|nr:SIMPL domain-containing protein [Verrucomicrobiota bacterium]